MKQNILVAGEWRKLDASVRQKLQDLGQGWLGDIIPASFTSRNRGGSHSFGSLCGGSPDKVDLVGSDAFLKWTISPDSCLASS